VLQRAAQHRIISATENAIAVLATEISAEGFVPESATEL
jgi:hypothetical protein